MNLVEQAVKSMNTTTIMNEVAVALEELSTKDQQELDVLMKEIGNKKMTPSEWKTFFANIMKDLNNMKDK